MRVTGCDTTFTIVSIKSGSTLTVPGSLDKFTVTNVEFKSNLIISGNVTMVDVAQVTNSEIKLTGSYKTVKLGSVESGAVVDISGTVETVIVNTLNSNSVIRISGDGSVKKIEAQLIETNGKIDLNSCDTEYKYNTIASDGTIARPLGCSDGGGGGTSASPSHNFGISAMFVTATAFLSVYV